MPILLHVTGNYLPFNISPKVLLLLSWQVCMIYFQFFRMKYSCGWQLAFTSPYIESIIERVALNAKVLTSSQSDNSNKMLAIAYRFQIRLWSITGNGIRTEIGLALHIL